VHASSKAAITGSTTYSTPALKDEDVSGIQVPEWEMGDERRSPKEWRENLSFGGWASFSAFDSMVPNQREDHRQPVQEAVSSQQGKEVGR
jgi:hypothetical protein